MEATFTDYYEVLEISPNASHETIERVFRHHARRYHPDNQETGDVGRFNEIVEAHNILRDPVKRAQYDVRFQNHSHVHRIIAEEASDSKGLDRDSVLQRKLLSLLYVKRRRNIDEPGLGNFELEKLADIAREHLDFHLWYLKEKGWIRTLENGQLAITVEGVDRVATEQQPTNVTRLLKDRSGLQDTGSAG